MENKLISINFDVMKAKAKETAQSVGLRAKEKKDQAFAGLLSKGIELSKKQLSALEKAKHNLG